MLSLPVKCQSAISFLANIAHLIKGSQWMIGKWCWQHRHPPIVCQPCSMLISVSWVDNRRKYKLSRKINQSFKVIQCLGRLSGKSAFRGWPFLLVHLLSFGHVISHQPNYIPRLLLVKHTWNLKQSYMVNYFFLQTGANKIFKFIKCSSLNERVPLVKFWIRLSPSFQLEHLIILNIFNVPYPPSRIIWQAPRDS